VLSSFTVWCTSLTSPSMFAGPGFRLLRAGANHTTMANGERTVPVYSRLEAGA
jgi:hypothetical protein